MDQAAGRKMLKIQQQAVENPDYQRLLEEYRLLDIRFRSAREGMTVQQRDAVDDYMGLCWEMHRFLLELACKEA